MRPSSPSSFSVPLGYRAPQQAPTETRFRTCASADPSPGNEIAAGPNGPTLPARLKKSIIYHTHILVKRALSTATRLSTPMRHPRETGPAELRPLGRGQANLPGNVVPSAVAELSLRPCRGCAGTPVLEAFFPASGPQRPLAAHDVPQSTEHTDGYAQIVRYCNTLRSTPELPRVCARRRSRSPSRPCGGDTSRRPPFPRRRRTYIYVPAADTRPSLHRAGCPHAWRDGAFREAGRTARPGRRRLPRRPLDALVRRWVAAAGRALRRRTGGAPPPLHATGWPRRGRGVPNPNPVANRSP